MTETTAAGTSAPTLMRAIGFITNRPVDDPEVLVVRDVPLSAVDPHDLLVEVRGAAPPFVSFNVLPHVIARGMITAVGRR